MTTQPLPRIHETSETAMTDEARIIRDPLPARFQSSYTTRHVASAVGQAPGSGVAPVHPFVGVRR